MYKKVLTILFVLLMVLPFTVVAQEPQQTLPAPIPQSPVEPGCCEGNVLFKGRINVVGGDPLQGSVVGLLTPDGNTVLDKETVGFNGTFTLGKSDVCEGDQYLVREIDPPGYESVSASGPGVTLDLNTVGFTITSCRNIEGILFVDGPLPPPCEEICITGKVVNELDHALGGGFVSLQRWSVDHWVNIRTDAVTPTGRFLFCIAPSPGLYRLVEDNPVRWKSLSDRAAAGFTDAAVDPDVLEFIVPSDFCGTSPDFIFVDTFDSCAPELEAGPAYICTTIINSAGEPAIRARVWIYTDSPGFLIVAGYGVADSNGEVTIKLNSTVPPNGHFFMFFSVRESYVTGPNPMAINRYSTNHVILYPGDECCQNPEIYSNYQTEEHYWK